jgi:hypothetical protein
MEHPTLLMERGITLSRGLCVYDIILEHYGYSTDGLLSIDYNQEGKPRRYRRYTMNDTPVPLQVLEKSNSFGPRARVSEVQTLARQIYIQNRIGFLEVKLSLLKTGTKNAEKILKGITGNYIPLPEGYSTEGVEYAIKNWRDFVKDLSRNLEEELTLLRGGKKLYDSSGLPKNLEQILAIDATKIAKSWSTRVLGSQGSHKWNQNI